MLLLVIMWACNSEPATTPPSPTPPPPAVGKVSGHPSGHPPVHTPKDGHKSGAVMQDPTGFPPFHDWPAPQGPVVATGSEWSAPVQLTKKPDGGYRPQIAVGPDNRQHVLFYERTDAGDLIRHRQSTDGFSWSTPQPLGHTNNRNWGPDIVAKPDGTLSVVYDHALPSFQSRGFSTNWTSGSWSTPIPLTPDDGGEVGSGHVANGLNDTLAYVYIGKSLDPNDNFQAHYRWFKQGSWGPIGSFTDGSVDAWHTNVERRPDGSLLAGWDVGAGGSETILYVVEGRNGKWGTPENISATSKPGERVHFAFGSDGKDHITWFHKSAGRPQHIYVRSGNPGRWGPVSEPSKGYGGYHFDPDIAINGAGVRCLVWGWDAGSQAELVYSIDRGQGWSPPRTVASIGWGKPGLPSIDVDTNGKFHVVWNQGIRGYNEVYVAHLEVR